MQLKTEPVYAAIDLGTNTCLLLIASLYQNNLTKIFEAQEIPRIGKELYKTGNISPESFETISKIFKRYILISKEFEANKILAFGTSAVREAKNNSEFITYIEKETGIKIRIITGEEEARYSFEGAVFDMYTGSNYEVIDIGGGSTELSFIENKKLCSISLNIGAVRLWENFFKENFSNENILKAQSFVREALSKSNFSKPENRDLIGVAGTVTTLSAIKNRLYKFSEDKIHKDVLKIEDIENIFQKLIGMSNAERLKLGPFMEGRSDIIIGGTLILIEVMKFYEFQSVIVSTKGLRYGLIINFADFIY